jgi:hypothetical protein
MIINSKITMLVIIFEFSKMMILYMKVKYIKRILGKEQSQKKMHNLDSKRKNLLCNDNLVLKNNRNRYINEIYIRLNLKEISPSKNQKTKEKFKLKLCHQFFF